MLAKRLLHPGPIIALFIITGLAFETYVNLLSIKKYHHTYYLYYLNCASFTIELCLLLSSYFLAIFYGPGTTPKDYTHQMKRTLDNLDESLQFCHKCNQYKPPRAHHCRTCNACSMRMDHHCLWINNCVGYKNYKSFFLFLLYVQVATIHSIFIGTYKIYLIYPSIATNPWLLFFYLDLWLSLILSIVVILACGFLLYLQADVLIHNKTEIESWICEKADYRRLVDPDLKEFIFPYNIDCMTNIKEIAGENLFLWLLPTESNGNGLDYIIRMGCGTYDLTKEQLQQKKEKRQQSVTTRIINYYNGSMFPILFGCKTMLNCPGLDSTRMSASKGDVVSISRTEAYWVYAEKLQLAGEANMMSPAERFSMRGWIPRSCVDELDTNNIAKEKNE